MKNSTMLSGLACLALTFALPAAHAHAQDDAPDFATSIEGLDHRDGVFDLYVDQGDGRILAELTTQGDGTLGRLVYNARLTTGLGSNPVGLDRGYGSSSEILRFTRVNDKVFAEFENMGYRALGAGPEEALATTQSFARSIIWSTEIIAEEDGRVLIDLSDFLTRDPVDTTGSLSGSGQGSFSIDSDRSAPLTNAAFAFPINVEIDALLTLNSSDPGPEVQAVTPAPNSVTLTVHHSFIALPEDGYQIREADDRSGAITMGFYDMATPLTDPVRRSYAVRHRLERVDPSATSGPVVEPIIYYVDRGAPELIREALIEGGNWWAAAFTNAGFEDAYRVELLPEGIHPLDARYNVIQWVHRQTRGWSYGGSMLDPRTGEIIRGYVILGSQRVRQDRMLFEGLLGAAGTGSGADDDPLELALDRIRQLSAHEIGHTIGLAHNFAASGYGRESVMDYPAPLVGLDEAGAIDVSQAYNVGIGEWDKVSVNWLYSQYDGADAREAGLESILDTARSEGLTFITDRHARGNNSGDPHANLWDNGSNVTDALNDTMAVRAVAMEAFGPHNMADGLPLSDLRAVFPTVYLHHRYQVEAAGKALGGVEMHYDLNTSDRRRQRVYPASEQRRALTAMVATLDPAALDISDDTLSLLVPAPYSDWDAIATRELFDSAQYPAFSRRDAATAASRITLRAMLSTARLARIADQSARDETQLSQDELFDALDAALFVPGNDEARRLAPVREAIQTEYVDRMLALINSGVPAASITARARLESLADGLPGRRRSAAGRRDHRNWLARRIEAGLAAIDTGESVASNETGVPPGSPIGSEAAAALGEDCWHCDSASLLGLGR